MYYIIAFHPTMGLTQKRWIRSEGQVINLIKEGFTVFRTGTDQIAGTSGEHRIVWTDVKETTEESSK